MARIEIDAAELERTVHQVLLNTIRDLYPQRFEYFYSSPPDLEQVIIDAIRYRYIRSQAKKRGDVALNWTVNFDAEIDYHINKEYDAT